MTSSSGAGVYPPLATISDTNHGAYVTVTALTMMFVMIVFVVARILYRYRVVSVIRLDDLFLILACAFAIVQSVCVQLATNRGLGRHRSDLSTSSFDLYEKFNYASQILLIAALVCAKISLVCLLEALQPQRSIAIVCRCTEGSIVLWGISAVIALALQCGVPRPWQTRPGKCVHQGALYTADGVINIVTDVVIMILPALIMGTVQTSFVKRSLVIGLFALRILVIAATIAQLVVLQPYLRSSDKTWTNVAPSIWNQVMMNISIIFACLPSLKRLLDELQPNKIGMVIPKSVELGSLSRYGISSTNYSSGGRPNFLKPSKSKNKYDDTRKKNRDKTSSIISSYRGRHAEAWSGDEAGSTKGLREDEAGSTKGLREDETMQTREFGIDLECEPRATSDGSGKTI